MTTMYTGVGSGGARGAAAPLNAGCRGLRPPTNLHQWVLETRCEIKLPAVIHSGYGTEARQVFLFAPAPQQSTTVVQGNLALPGFWRMPRLHDTWRRGLCPTITCTAGRRVCCCAEDLALQCLSLSDELINYIIIITIVCAIYTILSG